MGHIGGDLSVTDILVTLFGGVLSVDPERPDWPGARPLHPEQGPLRRRAVRDARALRLLPARRARHVHGAAVAAQRPSRTARRCPAWRPTPGRSGTASRSRSAARWPPGCAGCDWRTFVVLGDGELQEGSNWEAAMTAAHYGLDDAHRDRRPQPPPAGRPHGGHQAPRAARRQVARASAGRSREVDGHDHAALLDAFAPVHRPASRSP